MPSLIFFFYGLAHITLLLAFVALYTGVGRHLETTRSCCIRYCLGASCRFPHNADKPLCGFLCEKIWGSSRGAAWIRFIYLGLLGGVLCAQVLAGIVICSLIYVAGVALAIPSMITLYGDAAAPHRASGMALNGFVLFVGASLGPVIGALPLAFTTLMAFWLVGFS